MTGPMLHTVDVDSDAGAIYEAITTKAGAAAFWTSDCDVEPVVGSIARFGFPGAPVDLRMKIARPAPKLASMHVLKQLVGASEPCEHLPESVPAARANQCQECGSGFNIRLCATCGHVGCCDSQAGHARNHANVTGHPAIYANPSSPTPRSSTTPSEESRSLCTGARVRHRAWAPPRRRRRPGRVGGGPVANDRGRHDTRVRSGRRRRDARHE